MEQFDGSTCERVRKALREIDLVDVSIANVTLDPQRRLQVRIPGHRALDLREIEPFHVGWR